MSMVIAALDPGREKCGLAVMTAEGEVLLQKVIETAQLEQEMQTVVREHGAGRLILGNGTTSRQAQERIAEALPALEICVVDEYRTTEQAKKEYWKAHPPTGWRRLLPVTMQVPPVPVDDFVAVILARRHIGEME